MTSASAGVAPLAPPIARDAYAVCCAADYVAPRLKSRTAPSGSDRSAGQIISTANQRSKISVASDG